MLVCTLFPALPAGAAPPTIAALLSNSGQPYAEAFKGFRQYLEKKNIHADYKVYMLDGNPAKALQSVQEIRKNRPGLLLCLGRLATEKASAGIADIPIVSTMVLNEEELKSRNVTGVTLDFSPETAFHWMRRILPRVRTVGVVYDPGQNREKIAAASRAAQKLGLKLEAREVQAPRDLPAALEKLSNSADVLWGIADNVAMNPQSAKLILLFSFRNRIPFAGPSAAWVKAGALYSLDADYSDMGAQCGEMAFKIFQGSAAVTIPHSVPRRVGCSINRKTAGELGLTIPEDILRNAHNTF